MRRRIKASLKGGAEDKTPAALQGRRSIKEAEHPERIKGAIALFKGGEASGSGESQKKSIRKRKNSNMPHKAGIDINSNKFFRRCII